MLPINATPVQGALFMAGKNIRIIPLHPKSKVAILPKWQEKATTDTAEIIGWSIQYPNCNFGCVFKKGEVWGWDVDVAGLGKKFMEETGVALETLSVSSSESKGHYYFSSTELSDRLLHNISQKDAIDFSVRYDDTYCVCPSSVHPSTGSPYKLRKPNLVAAPGELVHWILRYVDLKKQVAKEEVVKDPTVKIKRGSIHGWMTSKAGELREKGLSGDEIEPILLRMVLDSCEGPIDEGKVRACAQSVGKYPHVDKAVIFPDLAIAVSGPVLPEIDQTALAPRPVFPLWAIEQTTLYDGFVRPVVESSSKNPEFLWLPAAQILMNYLSDKVQIANQTVNWNLFVGLVSDPGKFFKSSSCQLAQLYFNLMGLAETYTSAIRNSEGKVIMTQAGSSEGFGLAMKRINAAHAILWNDELSKLVAKIGIENSSLSSDIMTMYERGSFANSITNEKKHFSFPAGTYTFGMLWCTTTQGFNRHWPRLAGVVSGMEDRMFFCVGPEKPRPLAPILNADLMPGSVLTRQAVDRSIIQGIYKYEDFDQAQKFFAEWNDPRSQGLLEKFALYMAVDLQRGVIDAECLERSAAIVRFRNATTLYLAPIEADNAQARVQLEMEREIRKNEGKMSYRKLCQDMNSSRYGTDFWNRAYKTMVESGRLVKFEEPGKRGQKKHMVGIPKLEDED